MATVIGAGCKVSFHYTLRDDSDVIMDASSPDEPASYVHGCEELPPGLEAALSGRLAGDSVTVDLKPEDAFGEHDGRAPRAVPPELFSETEAPYVGMPVIPEDDDDETTSIMWVIQVGRDSILLDTNHPLAGMALSYHVEVLSVVES